MLLRVAVYEDSFRAVKAAPLSAAGPPAGSEHIIRLAAPRNSRKFSPNGEVADWKTSTAIRA